MIIFASSSQDCCFNSLWNNHFERYTYTILFKNQKENTLSVLSYTLLIKQLNTVCNLSVINFLSRILLNCSVIQIFVMYYHCAKLYLTINFIDHLVYFTHPLYKLLYIAKYRNFEVD